MRNPLRYQMSEYDCGPTAMLNQCSIWQRRDTAGSDSQRDALLSGLL